MAQVADEQKMMESEVFRSKYRRIKDVGKGSFGSALLVRCRHDGRRYICKAMECSAMTQKEKRDVQNEIRILAAVNHPNIVRYYEHFEDGSVIFIIMEYADGGDLNSRIKEAKKAEPQVLFDPKLVMFWFLQICMALKYLHDNHILHRDLKAANVFLTSKNVVKLGDFGISTVLQNTMACAKTVCGTPYYFSPELCQTKPYNNKSDIWALGVVFYEALALRRPFNGKNLKELVKNIISGQYEPLPNSVPAEMRALCATLLQVNSTQRPSINRILESEFVQSSLKLFSGDLEHQISSGSQGEKDKWCASSARGVGQPPSTPLHSNEAPPLSEREQLAALRGMKRGALKAMVAHVGGGEIQPSEVQLTKEAVVDSEPDDWIDQKKQVVKALQSLIGSENLGGHPEEFGDSPEGLSSMVEYITMANGENIPPSKVQEFLEKEVGDVRLNRALLFLSNISETSKLSNGEIHDKLISFLGASYMQHAYAIEKLALWKSSS